MSTPEYKALKEVFNGMDFDPFGKGLKSKKKQPHQINTNDEDVDKYTSAAYTLAREIANMPGIFGPGSYMSNEKVLSRAKIERWLTGFGGVSAVIAELEKDGWTVE